MKRLTLFLLVLESAIRAQTIPSTGTTPQGMSAFNDTMISLMNRYQVPGAALAVYHGGKLAFARGYGFANTSTGVQVQPDSLFRIASITKPHTAAAILKLVERGQLSLNDKAFAILSDLTPLPGFTEDSRVAQITVLDLLNHMSGWYGEADGTGYDPLFDVDHIAQVAGTTPPADPRTIIRYMLGRPLDRDPGTYYSYLNFGYLVLGQLIAELSGESYESFVTANVTGPLSNNRSQFGASLTALPGEVSYYGYPGEPLAYSVFPTGPALVPWPYGGYSLEANHANGGLVSNTIELLRFLSSVNGSYGPQLFQTAVEGFPGYVPPSGAGWSWYFHGSLPGNNTSLALLSDQTALCWLTNTRPQDSTSFFNDFDSQLINDIAGMTSWPATDLFSQFATSFDVVHAADSHVRAAAPDQFVTLYGFALGTSTEPATTIPLPTKLGGVTVTVTDSTGNSAQAPLSYVSQNQVNLIIPSALATGAATIAVARDSGTLSTTAQIDAISPGIFTMNGVGSGVPAALAGLYAPDGSVKAVDVFACSSVCDAVPMDTGGPNDKLIVSLYATGLRHARNPAAVSVTMKDQPAQVYYAGAQGQFAGLDQVNVQVPYALKSAGLVPVQLKVDGRVSNVVTISIE